MQRRAARRLAALALLVVALAAPAAWAAPRGGAGWEGGWLAQALWGWVASLWAKDGPAGDPDGRPASGWQKDGPDSDPAGRPADAWQKDGPGSDPACRPPGAADLRYDGPLIDPDGKP